MADTETRQDVVEANIDNTIGKFGEDNWVKIMVTCLKDISISLAMLVDGASSSGGGNSV